MSNQFARFIFKTSSEGLINMFQKRAIFVAFAFGMAIVGDPALAATPPLPPTPTPTKAPQCNCSEDRYSVKDGECFKEICDLKVKCEPNKSDGSSGMLGKPEKIDCTQMPPAVTPPGGGDGSGGKDGGKTPPITGGKPNPDPSPAKCPSEEEGGDGGNVGECNDGDSESIYFVSEGQCFESTVSCENGCWFYEINSETVQMVPLTYCFNDNGGEDGDTDSGEDGDDGEGSGNNNPDGDKGDGTSPPDGQGSSDEDEDSTSDEDSPPDEPGSDGESDSTDPGDGGTPGGGANNGGSSGNGGTTQPPVQPPQEDYCPPEEEGGNGGKWPQCEDGDSQVVGPPFSDPNDPGSCYQLVIFCGGGCWLTDGGSIPVDPSLCGGGGGGGDLRLKK